jgi:hypothetical protein
MTQYYFVYKTKCKVNEKIYIGAHKTKNINDGYIGSGTLLSNAIKKYGYEMFEREIIKFFDSEKEMYDYESILINEEFLKRNDIYNLSLGGLGGDRSKFISEEGKKRRSEKNAGPNNAYYGKRHSKKIREKISKKLLEKDENWRKSNASNAGKKNLGKTRSEETKIKYSEISKNRNSYICPYCKKEGQYNAMIGYHGEKCKMNPNAEKRIWVNNGLKNKLVIESNIPEGYNIGRKKENE